MELELGKLYDTHVEDTVLSIALSSIEGKESAIAMVDSSDFYQQKHKDVFKAVEEMSKKNIPVDIVTVFEYIKNNGKSYDKLPEFLSEITNCYIPVSNIEKHFMILKQISVKRKSVIELKKYISSCWYSQDIGDDLTKLGSTIDSLMEMLIGNDRLTTINDILKNSLESMYRRAELFRNGVKVVGYDTGLQQLNDYTSGFMPGELIVVAGRPGMGKTSIMIHFAKSMAIYGKKVAIFSLEMPSESIVDKIIISETNIHPEKYRSGSLSNDEFCEIEKASGRVFEMPIIIDDTPSTTIMNIKSKSAIMNRKGECDVVFIDYLQLIGSSEKEFSREREVAKMTRMAKIMAKELDIPVIMLSQLNRDSEKREDKRPKLGDLRESGAIEQDADKVIFIHRPEYYGEEFFDDYGVKLEGVAELIVSKNRNGKTGAIKVMHTPGIGRFYDYYK